MSAAVEAIRAVPGLGMLIALAGFNNLLGGVFMALMDAYGLELVSVEAWGFIWGFLSTGFTIGGLIVSKRGLGPTPVKVVVLGNLVNWIVCSVFTVQSSIVLLTIGTFIWIGGWFGTGPERGIALAFTLAGVIGIVVTVPALGSRSYRQLTTIHTSEPEPAVAG